MSDTLVTMDTMALCVTCKKPYRLRELFPFINGPECTKCCGGHSEGFDSYDDFGPGVVKDDLRVGWLILFSQEQKKAEI